MYKCITTPAFIFISTWTDYVAFYLARKKVKDKSEQQDNQFSTSFWIILFITLKSIVISNPNNNNNQHNP